ncbi:MAG: hypothetical protein M0R03_14495 [Novosphingobium sp.]|nr:hypothetical protein [Novosphingobium sp.]
MNWREKLLKVVSNDEEAKNKLNKAGYVEELTFQPFVERVLEEGKELMGYYCATCEYSRKGYCTKLDAQIKSFGCCNLWEFHHE